jgi:hypothetical protein
MEEVEYYEDVINQDGTSFAKVWISGVVYSKIPEDHGELKSFLEVIYYMHWAC